MKWLRLPFVCLFSFSAESFAMAETPNSATPKNPTDIARETFKRLAIERIAPTPDAYRKLYFEIAGIVEQPEPKPEPVS